MSAAEQLVPELESWPRLVRCDASHPCSRCDDCAGSDRPDDADDVSDEAYERAHSAASLG